MKRLVDGMLVAIEANDYPNFTDRQTGEIVPAGTTYNAWVVEDQHAAPVAVKLRDQAQAIELDPQIGKKVKIKADISARENTLVLRAEAGKLLANVA